MTRRNCLLKSARSMLKRFAVAADGKEMDTLTKCAEHAKNCAVAANEKEVHVEKCAVHALNCAVDAFR